MTVRRVDASGQANLVAFHTDTGSLRTMQVALNRQGSDYGGGSLVRKGLSYAPNPGNPVRAVHAGRVVFADWLRGSGLLIVLDHGQGYMSLYGHNEALTVSGGDWVDAGEVLARSGINSSDRTAGLYFEIRRNGEPQDPTAWLR